MTLTPLRLLEQLRSIEQQTGKPRRIICALSGGQDSVVLLHTLSALRESGDLEAPLSAAHINHGLQRDAEEWSTFCRDFANSLQVEITVTSVIVDRTSGFGLEAAARDARYNALQAQLTSGDWLITAHHKDDNAETLLINLIRGSGAAGLSGIAPFRPLGSGTLVRPLLNFDRQELAAYADEKALEWCEDMTNLDQRFDRNFLRQEITPRLMQRWPDIASRLSRSARHLKSAEELLQEVAQADFRNVAESANRIRLTPLTRLSSERQANVLRFALKSLDLPLPTTRHMEALQQEVIGARDDAEPLLEWRGTSVRRYRDHLYLLPTRAKTSISSAEWDGKTFRLGDGLGQLRLLAGATHGLSEALVSRGLRIERRRGGERIKLTGQTHTRKLKNLLQEAGVVPWMRDSLPLVYAGEQLVAVADLFMAKDATEPGGMAIEWIDRPALH